MIDVKRSEQASTCMKRSDDSRRLNPGSKTELFQVMKDTAAAVDALILAELSKISRDPLVPTEAILHLPKIRAAPRGQESSPKLRATFSRLVFELCSAEDWHQVVPLAAVGELLAISSYIVDDWLDHQERRNSEAATWVAFGPAEAIMAAQVQREVAEAILLRLSAPAERLLRLVGVLNTIFYEGYLGQLVDSRIKAPCPIEHYIRRCEGIAGHFHGGLARMAAIFAGAPNAMIKQIQHLGFLQGIALQIRNDLVDVIPSSILASAGAHALARTPLEDFCNGKWTMPLLFGYEHANGAEREFLTSAIHNRAGDDQTVNRLTRILVRTGAYDATLTQITLYREKACQTLLGFPQSPARDLMETLLHAVENTRSYVQRTAVQFA